MASIRELAKARGISPATAVRYRKAGIDLEDQAAVDRYKEECAARQFVSKTMPKIPAGAVPLFTSSAPAETELTQTLGLFGAIQRLREVELSLANQAAQGDKSAFSRWALAIETLRKAFNNTLSTLRAVLEIGIERGVIFTNPAKKVARATARRKQMRIPSREDFKRVVAEIRSAEGAVSQCSADLVEFLSYSGCRIDESRWVKWTDVDRRHEQIWIGGHEVTGTKSGEGRWVPIVPAMGKLLDDLQANPRYPRSARRQTGGYLLAVRECQKAIDRACERLGVQRFSHHDCRHLFCTAAVEAGVDFLTIAKWCGHADATLIASTYGHVRSDHSKMMAAKVVF